MRLEKLQGILGYKFVNIDLLRQALTRQKAIEDKVPGAAAKSYQTLEFVGDPLLKACIARILYKKFPAATEGELHATTQLFIKNADLPAAARRLKLQKFILKGSSEPGLTDKMMADALEAVIGAVTMDARNFGKVCEIIIIKSFKPQLDAIKLISQQAPLQKQVDQKSEIKAGKTENFGKLVERIITRPIDPRLDASELISQHFFGDAGPEEESEENLEAADEEEGDYRSALSQLSLKTNLPAEVKNEPLTPRTQNVFNSLGLKKNKIFNKALKKAPHAVNAQNSGRIGDTPLMALLRRQIKGGKKLPEDKGISKVKTLLKAGALWHVPNKRGETAASLVKQVPEDIRKSFDC